MFQPQNKVMEYDVDHLIDMRVVSREPPYTSGLLITSTAITQCREEITITYCNDDKMLHIQLQWINSNQGWVSNQEIVVQLRLAHTIRDLIGNCGHNSGFDREFLELPASDCERSSWVTCGVRLGCVCRGNQRGVWHGLVRNMTSLPRTHTAHTRKSYIFWSLLCKSTGICELRIEDICKRYRKL